MRGNAGVEVDFPVDWDEVESKANNQEFVMFYPTDIEYIEEEWDFDLMNDAEQDNDIDPESA